MLMNSETFPKALLTRLQIFVSGVSKPSLLFKLIPNSFHRYCFNELIIYNTRIYNLSSGPHITHFLAVVAK